MRWLTSIFAAMVLSAPMAAAQGETTTPVHARAGVIQGLVLDGQAVFRGIPYATPPVGPLRWHPPAPPQHWHGVLAADSFRDNCTQGSGKPGSADVFAKPSNTEDCLYLNVFLPGLHPEGRKPVMVFIPGGGLLSGEADDYDGRALARDGHVVVVTFNYRLGYLGFMALPSKRRVANFGFLDQQAALRWVRENIAAFGGDPRNVTLFGESSGGASVFAHLASPLAKGLFHRAIAESGSYAALQTLYVTPWDKALAVSGQLAASLGCATADRKCLEAVPATAVLAATAKLPRPGQITGDIVLPVSFADAFASGRFNRMPLINGTNRDEWRWNVVRAELASGKVLTAADYPAAAAKFFGTENAPAITAQYPSASFPSPSEALAAAETDYFMACPAYKLDGWIGRYAPVHAYEFEDPGVPFFMDKASFPTNSIHTGELQFLFPGFHGYSGKPSSLTPAEQALSAQMIRYWTRFALQGDPNGAGDPAWPQSGMLKLMPDGSHPFEDFAQEHRCAFWDGLSRY